MLKVVFLDALPGVEVIIRHSLDDELLILTKEEETTRFTLRLISLEHHLSVSFWIK